MSFNMQSLTAYSKELTLLCIDDSLTARSFYQKVLGEHFKSLTLSEDGDIGLKAFNQNRQDIVITDINMPNISGIEVARFIKKVSPNTPVIISTSFSEESDLIECIKIGIDGYIKKSANPDELLQTLWNAARTLIQDMELHKRERIMIQQSKLSSMGELLVNIAHQWRQPLNYMSLTIQELKDAHDMGELDSDYFNDITNSTMNFVTTMSKTIDDFATYFQPDMDKETFCIDQVLRDALKMQSLSTSEMAITVKKDIPEGLELQGYKKSFMQSVMHLLKNAQDAIIHTQPEVKMVMIKASSQQKPEGLGQEIILEICDTGGGITEENFDKVYDPYFTTYFQSSGKGLGLYICKKIIEDFFLGTLSHGNHDFEIEGKACRGACFKIVI